MGFAKVRLFVDQPLGPGQPVALSEGQAHYLVSVMRLGSGAQVLVFNGRDGEWQARLDAGGRRQSVVVPEVQTAPLRLPPDLWLVFAPLKKARTDFIVEKATELGAARLLPVQTRFTNADRIARDRLQAHAIEAAEQCGGTFVPVVEDLQPLERLLDTWPEGRRVMWCDEHLAGRSSALTGVIAGRSDDARQGGRAGGGWAIVVGPEGGFAEAEQARLRAMAGVWPVSLGPRILRADTAAVAALTLWQAMLGDWG
jgi:16S rRNA (uracil1498-N3)-methyltransferase